MSQQDHSGRRKAKSVLIGCGVVFLLLLVIVNPVGDALAARGVPNAVIGAVLTLVVLVLLAVVIGTWTRSRARRMEEFSDAQQVVVEGWAGGAGWRPEAWSGGVPAVLDRPRVQSSDPVTSVTGAVAGLASTLTVWRQSYANRGSPVTGTVVWVVLTVDGLPPAAQIALGQVGAGAVLGRMPTRWAGAPPVSLLRAPSTHPWGLTKVMVWPGTGVPPPPAWGPVAAEIEALRGWLIVSGGRLELAVPSEADPVPAQRLIALAHRAIGMAGGLA